jgi:hypothetical protein
MIIMHIQANKGNFMEISFVEEQVEVGDDQELWHGKWVWLVQSHWEAQQAHGGCHQSVVPVLRTFSQWPHSFCESTVHDPVWPWLPDSICAPEPPSLFFEHLP